MIVKKDNKQNNGDIMPNQDEVPLPEYQEFYVNTSLYTKYQITNEDKESIFNLLFDTKTIDCYCPECKKHSVFHTLDNRPRQGTIGAVPGSWDIWNYNLETSEDIFFKVFICTRERKHKMKFYMQIKDSILSKIGQTPSVADLAEYEIKKYKKILGDFYTEFNKAIGLFAHGIGSGSYVYLRRIIENFIIKPAYDKAKQEPKWDEENYQRSRYKEKVEILKSKLPAFLTENIKLYSVLSKGIHEMTEQECKKNFTVMKNCIEVILEELEADRKKEIKREEMKKALENI